MNELLVPGPAIGLASLLDLPTGAIDQGWELPLLWHWVYFVERPPQSDLGPEGHGKNGILRPPREGLRRMYAGGRVDSRRPLILGEDADATLEILGTRERHGRSGWMTIVTTRRTIRQRGEVALTDEADIIYRQATRLKAVDAATAETAAEEVVGTEIAVDEASLFRFSALTYNAHRIHYDVDYCRAEEDYPDLVVHGPLQALLMSEEARRVTGSGARTRFEFRLVSPLILGQGLVVDTAEQDGAVTTRVRDRYGRVTAMGRLIRSDASRGTRAVPPDAARLS